MDSKILSLIIIAILAISISVIAMIIFIDSPSNQLAKKQLALEKRLIDHEREFSRSCSPYDEIIEYKGVSWCVEEDEYWFDYMNQDCSYAIAKGYLTWCEYYGFR